MIIFTQIDLKKCFLLVLKKPAILICNILYFAKYFAKHSKAAFFFSDDVLGKHVGRPFFYNF